MKEPKEPTIYAVDPMGNIVALSRTVGYAANKSKGESLKPGWRLATQADFDAKKPPAPRSLAPQKPDPIKIESK